MTAKVKRLSSNLTFFERTVDQLKEAKELNALIAEPADDDEEPDEDDDEEDEEEEEEEKQEELEVEEARLFGDAELNINSSDDALALLE